MKSTFQKRLQERMDELGFRQADLAERTGLSKSRISHYINGRYEAKQEALYLLAKALDVNEAWLMGHDVPKERSISEVHLPLPRSLPQSPCYVFTDIFGFGLSEGTVHSPQSEANSCGSISVIVTFVSKGPMRIF